MKVTLIAAISIDGKIAKHELHNVDWTSKQDKKIFHDTAQKSGVLIIGNNTHKAIGRALPGFKTIVMTHTPKKYQKESIKNTLEFVNVNPETLVDKLGQQGYTECVVGGGCEIFSLFLNAHCVNVLHLTVIPHIFGKGIPLFDDSAKPHRLKLINHTPLGEGEYLLSYSIDGQNEKKEWVSNRKVI